MKERERKKRMREKKSRLEGMNYAELHLLILAGVKYRTFELKLLKQIEMPLKSKFLERAKRPQQIKISSYKWAAF